jgi:integrase
MENQVAQGQIFNPVAVASGTYVDGDQAAVRAFLRQMETSPLATERAYKKAVRCFLVWLLHTGYAPGNALATVNLADIENYFRFLRSSTPLPKTAEEGAGCWKGPAPLAAASLEHAKTLLANFFDKLCDYETAPGVAFRTTNPVRAIGRVVPARRELRKPGEVAPIADSDGTEKVLLPEDVDLILESIEAMPKETDRQLFHFHRCRWVFLLAYRSWLRLSEIARLQMGDFRFDQNGAWRLYVHPSKHQQEGVLIDVLPGIMEALQVYRQSLGMMPYPVNGEPHSAILQVSRKKIEMPPVVTALKLRNGEPSGGVRIEAPSPAYKPLTERAIFGILEKVFRNAAAMATTPWQRGRLMEASPHWLRHSGITHALNAGMDPRYVASQARHKSLKTTLSTYDHGLDVEARRREASKLSVHLFSSSSTN